MRLHNPLQFAFLYSTLSLISTAFCSTQISLFEDIDAVLQLPEHAEFNYFFPSYRSNNKTIEFRT